MAWKVVWTEGAWSDLSSIADFIHHDSPYYAASFVQEMKDAARSLAEFAEHGRIVPEYHSPNIRELFIHRYRLIYKLDEKFVSILAVVHGARIFQGDTVMTAEEIIKIFNLEPLPEEGGFYRELYRAKGNIQASALGGIHKGDRSYGTHIFYLVTPDEFSALHRLPQDELFHFYLGDPVEMFQIDPEGKGSKVVFGSDVSKGQVLFHRVKPNTWQGTRIIKGGRWALLGCTVIPGFDFKDFEIQSRAQLLESYPQHRDNIIRFTRS